MCMIFLSILASWAGSLVSVYYLSEPMGNYMNEYSTALLQIVSTQISHQELTNGVGLRNYARKQPEAPNAYYCFETAALCSTDSLNDHIEKLAMVLRQAGPFVKERASAGDEITLLWFPGNNAEEYTVLTPGSLKFLGEMNISYLIKNKT